MRIEQNVSDVMTERVVGIEMDRPVSEAVSLMRQENLRKVLLFEGGMPKGVLEDWMAAKMEQAKPIREALADLHVTPPPVTPVPPNLTILEAEAALASFAALVVVEDPRNPKAIRGIVTSTDLYKAKPKFF